MIRTEIDMTESWAIGTETGAVATGYRAVDEASVAIDGRIASIRDQLQQASAGWEGEAARAFASLMADFETSAGNLQGVLRTLETNLRQVEGIQTTQEEAATAAARNAAGSAFPGF